MTDSAINQLAAKSVEDATVDEMDKGWRFSQAASGGYVGKMHRQDPESWAERADAKADHGTAGRFDAAVPGVDFYMDALEAMFAFHGETPTISYQGGRIIIDMDTDDTAAENIAAAFEPLT